jgi:hypothetical protein
MSILHSGSWKTVRKREEFGQISITKQENGPKKRRIRTVFRVKARKRSERGKNSDRFQSESKKTVRKSEEYGQISI